jgi:hypothetical protein
VVIKVLAEQRAGIDGHRTVEKDRDVCQPLCGFQSLQVEHQRLRAANRERRDHDRAAAADSGLDDGG